MKMEYQRKLGRVWTVGNLCLITSRTVSRNLDLLKKVYTNIMKMSAYPNAHNKKCNSDTLN